MSQGGVNWFVLWEECLPLLSTNPQFLNPLPPCRSTASNSIRLLCPYSKPPTFPMLPAWKCLIYQYFDFCTGIIDQRHLVSAVQRKIYFYFFPSRSPALPCSILSSLTLCVTPTQGLWEMNGLIPVGMEWNMTCTRWQREAPEHTIKYSTHTQMHTALGGSGKRRQINGGNGPMQSQADEDLFAYTHNTIHTPEINMPNV